MTEKHRLVASHTHLTKDQTHNPGTIPDRKLNLRPFGVRGQRHNHLSHPAWALNYFLTSYNKHYLLNAYYVLDTEDLSE